MTDNKIKKVFWSAAEGKIKSDQYLCGPNLLGTNKSGPNFLLDGYLGVVYTSSNGPTEKNGNSSKSSPKLYNSFFCVFPENVASLIFQFFSSASHTLRGYFSLHEMTVTSTVHVTVDVQFWKTIAHSSALEQGS